MSVGPTDPQRLQPLPLLFFVLHSLVLRPCSSRRYLLKSEVMEKSRHSDLEGAVPLARFHTLKDAMHTTRRIVNSLVQL